MAQEPARRKLTVLISGSGTNLAALLKACNTPSLPNTEIVRVISNRKNAYGLVRAQEAGVKTSVWTLAGFRKSWNGNAKGSVTVVSQSQPQSQKAESTKEKEKEKDEKALRSAYDSELAKIVLQDAPDLVVLAGFMHILSPDFLAALRTSDLRTPIINLHPALPHAFNGANAIGRAWEAFNRGEIKKTGIMCHYVIEEVDEGEVICVREIEMHKGESLADLEERLHKEEWQIIVEGAQKALDRITASS